MKIRQGRGGVRPLLLAMDEGYRDVIKCKIYMDFSTGKRAVLCMH